MAITLRDKKENFPMRSSSLLVASCYLCVSSAVLADIRFAETTTIEGAGGMSIFASKVEAVTEISGSKSRVDSKVSMESTIARMFADEGPSSDIILVDEGRSLRLLPDKKQYYVMTFAEARQQLESSRQAMKDAQSSESGLPVSAQGCEWTDGGLEVEHPSGTTKIAGIKTRRHTIWKRQFCHDAQTGNTCDITLFLETWLAKKVPGEAEVLQFRKAQAVAMGLDTGKQEHLASAQNLLAMFGDNWSEIESEFEGMRGFPMRTIMEMKMGGQQCTTASGKPIAEDGLWSDASGAAYDAAVGQTAAEAGSAVGDAAGESLGDSVGGSIGGAAVGAATSELIGGLSSMFKRKKKTAKPSPKKLAEDVMVFRITTEVNSWDKERISSDRFDEPAGWKKIKRPQ
jgi:hypothetical protein